MNLFDTDIKNAINTLGQDSLTNAIQNVAQYQPLEAPTATPTPKYDLNNIEQYFQTQNPSPAAQQQQPQPQQQTYPMQQNSSPAQQQQPGKIIYRGKTYSENNPILARFPTNPHFRPSGELLQKAQEWENQNVVNQVTLERQRQLDDADSFTVTPELLNRLPENSVYRQLFVEGQRVPFNQLDKIQKGVEAQRGQEEIQAMTPQIEQAYAGIPDDNPYKPMIQFALQSAYQSGDPKQVNYAYGLIKSAMAYITPKAQTPAQAAKDKAQVGQITSKTTGQNITNQYLPGTLQAGINQKNAAAARSGNSGGNSGKNGNAGSGLSKNETNAVITNILAKADTYRSKLDFLADINKNQRSRLVALLGVDGYNKLVRAAKSTKASAVGGKWKPVDQRADRGGYIGWYLNQLEKQLKGG
jgi:hypothetical protein